MKTVAFIPVRGGSKSIPGKNIKEFNQKPLLYWTAKAAQDCSYIDQIIIATDDEQIANCALNLGLNKITVYRRSPENAIDTASTESVMLEFLKSQNFENHDLFVLIQATNPFLMANDLNHGFELLKNKPSGSIISCATYKRFIWNADGTPINYDFMDRPRRQDFKGTLLENGAYYINSVGNIKQTGNRLKEPIQVAVMGEFTAVEIDEDEDWIIAEKIHRKFILNQTES